MWMFLGILLDKWFPMNARTGFNDPSSFMFLWHIGSLTSMETWFLSQYSGANVQCRQQCQPIQFKRESFKTSQGLSAFHSQEKIRNKLSGQEIKEEKMLSIEHKKYSKRGYCGNLLSSWEKNILFVTLTYTGWVGPRNKMLSFANASGCQTFYYLVSNIILHRQRSELHKVRLNGDSQMLIPLKSMLNFITKIRGWPGAGEFCPELYPSETPK